MDVGISIEGVDISVEEKSNNNINNFNNHRRRPRCDHHNYTDHKDNKK